MPHPVTTRKKNNYCSHALITPTATIFNRTFLFWPNFKTIKDMQGRKLWLVGVWSVRVASRCGFWVWSLGRILKDVISDQCM